MLREVSEYVEHGAFHAGAEDATGNPVEQWADPVTVGIYAFDPGSSSEPREGNDRVIVEPTLYMPATVIFAHRDVVWARGKRYEVDGETREWVHPTDPSRSANVATLRRVDG